MFALEAAGYPIVFTVHDEIVVEHPDITLRCTGEQAVAKRIQALLEDREHIHATAVELAIEKTGIKPRREAHSASLSCSPRR